VPADDESDGAVVLEGAGVVLRCLRPDDLAAHLAGEDDDTVRWLTEGHRSEPERTAAWILENRQQWATGGPRRHLGICVAGSGALIGGVEAHLEPAPPGTDRPLHVNISYAVFPGWRGRGAAARAVELLCAWLPEAFGARVAVLRIAPGNEPSLRVAGACGFTLQRTSREGVLEHERPLDPAHRGVTRAFNGSRSPRGAGRQ